MEPFREMVEFHNSGRRQHHPIRRRLPDDLRSQPLAIDTEEFAAFPFEDITCFDPARCMVRRLEQVKFASTRHHENRVECERRPLQGPAEVQLSWP